MGERAKVNINEYTALEIVKRADFDLNHFYSSDYKIFIKALLKENERLNKGLEYAKRVEKDYKEKFDKTIEYLGIDEDILKTCEMYDVNGIEVYKILQGVSNENSNE